jgi:hypothetical protein
MLSAIAEGIKIKKKESLQNKESDFIELKISFTGNILSKK